MEEGGYFLWDELNKRMMQLHREGCPNCHYCSDRVDNKFFVYSTEVVKRIFWFGRRGAIYHHPPRPRRTISIDYIVCVKCLWREKITFDIKKEKENGKEK